MALRTASIVVQRLKNGEYDGGDIMFAWIGLEELAATNEKVRVLREALEQITLVYAAMRLNLTKMYPQDGWSSETVTLDKANAALAATSTEPKDEQT